LVLKHQRFKSTYLPELIELLNDEEAYIRIEALEIMTEILELMSAEIVEKEFIPVIFNTMEATIEDIILRLANIIGKIVYKLQNMEQMHLKYK
jgi:hypothetical protein